MTEPTPEPTEPAEPAPQPRAKIAERPHPLTPLIELWVVVLAAAFFVVRDLAEHPDRLGRGFLAALGWPALVAGGLALVGVGLSVINWLTIRFVIDDDEVRIERGWLSRRSTKVRFDRIQSVELHQAFAARLVGAAELRIEAGAGSGGLSLKYLTRARANELRAILLRRAHAEAAPLVADAPTDAPTPPDPTRTSVIDDRATDEEVLVRLPAGQIVLGGLASPSVVFGVLFLLVALCVQLLLGVTGFALLGSLVPFVLVAWSFVSAALLAQLNYSLARSARGLRVTRGLTNLTSQNFPLDRVQGVRVSRTLLHRAFGLWRVHVDLLGTKATAEQKGTSPLLLPAATKPQVDLVLSHLLPDVDLDALDLRETPRRAVWLLGPWRRTYRWALTDRVTVSQHGWFEWRRDIIPHEKMQSVELSQGPLSRALGLASVHVQNTTGPVDLHVHTIDADEAGRLVLTELALAKRARAASAR